MNEFLLGAYWKARGLTLQEFADLVRGFVQLLRKVHPAFATLQWVGDRPDSSVRISDDLENLRELIFRHSWERRDIRGQWTIEGIPSGDATNDVGFGFTLNTGKSSKEGGITVGIRAGNPKPPVPNSVTIAFPGPEDERFEHRSFFDYQFLKGLFVETIRYWQPERAVVTARDYSKLVYPAGPAKSGWLTYFTDSRAAELARAFPTEPLEVPGTVLTLGPNVLSARDPDQLSVGIRLRDSLKASGLS